MTKKPFSEDFRKIVLKKLSLGATKVSLAKEFDIAPRTIYIWEKNQKNEGRTAFIPYKSRDTRKKTDGSKIKVLDEFKIFVDENPGKTSSDLAKLWGEKTGINVSHMTILRTMKKINYTFKKKLHFIKSNAHKKGLYLQKK